MKSSSRLFPARLVRAEVIGSCTEDTYLIKPNNSPDKLVEIAVTHLVSEAADCSVPRPALILFHGCYQNRYFWYSPAGEGVAIDLLKYFDVWLMEARGHGLSPVNQRFGQNTLIDYACYDLPAVNAFVAEKTEGSPLWLGHAEGAASLLYAVANGSLLPVSTAAVLGVGKPWLSPWWLRVPGGGLLQSLLVRDYHHELARGPEPEPSSLVKAYRQEQSLLGRPGAGLGVSLWQQLASTGIPLGWFASKQELAQVDKQLQILEGKTLRALGAIGESPCGFDPLNRCDANVLVQLLESCVKEFLGASGAGSVESAILSAGEAASAA